VPCGAHCHASKVSFTALQNLVSNGPNNFSRIAGRHEDGHLREAIAKSIGGEDSIQKRLGRVALPKRSKGCQKTFKDGSAIRKGSLPNGKTLLERSLQRDHLLRGWRNILEPSLPDLVSEMQLGWVTMTSLAPSQAIIV
jgi:hypothetical protein